MLNLGFLNLSPQAHDSFLLVILRDLRKRGQCLFISSQSGMTSHSMMCSQNARFMSPKVSAFDHCCHTSQKTGKLYVLHHNTIGDLEDPVR